MFKALRWVTYDPEFEEFDCVFIGDVDMMILRESPDICQFRVLTFGLSTHADVRGLEVTGSWPDRLALTVNF